jgi:hypothetical protein
MARLIALYSTVPQSGKTTLANHLNFQHEFHTVKFAGPIKAMLYTLLRTYKDDAVWAYECIEGKLKETPIKFLANRTPRQMMISLGTNWGREMVDPNIWVTAGFAQAKQHLDKGENVVIDDMRFPNEYNVLKHLGAEFIKVTRLGVPGVGGATTEGLLMGADWDLEIKAQDGDTAALYDTMDDYLKGLI